MMKTIVALLVAMVASASAFVPTQQAVAFGVRSASSSLQMAMQQPSAMDAVKNGVIASVAGAVSTVMPSMALATEGTNEWFGVDDIRLLAVLFVVHWAILTLYLQQYGDADEEDDFFGEIDYSATKK